MQVPLEITYRGVDKTNELESLVREKIDKLEEVCDHITSCHVAIEKPHDRPSHGSPYRVRIDMRVPPGHELAVVKNPGEGVQYDPVDAVIRQAFDAARRQLVSLNAKQHGRVQNHPEQEVAGIVVRLFPEEDYGFLKSPLDGQEIYFHRNSVLHNDFDRITIGTGVQFFSVEGEKGPQATTVKIISKPGSNVNTAEEQAIEPPLGWE